MRSVCSWLWEMLNILECENSRTWRFARPAVCGGLIMGASSEGNWQHWSSVLREAMLMAMIKDVSSRIYSRSQEHDHKSNLKTLEMPGTQQHHLSPIKDENWGPERVKSLAEGHTTSGGIVRQRICSWGSNSSLPTSSLGLQFHKAFFIYFLSKDGNAAFKLNA